MFGQGGLLMKILVLGGTRFFGKKLVQLLIEEGHDVTIATRGNVQHPFGSQVKQVKVDRKNASSLKDAVGEEHWDIVYDNICFSPNEALAACEIFDGKTKKYILTSTLSTLDQELGSDLTEEDFNPYTYEIRYGDVEDFSYGEGKRQAEAVFFQKASFPIVAVRFPIVLGEDDYTKRLHFHIERVAKEQPIGFVNMDARMSYILSDDAAGFLKFAGTSNIEGPFNATSTGSYSMQELIDLIEEATGKKAKITLVGNDESRSPFGVPKDWYMTPQKAKEASYEFLHLDDWLPSLIKKLASEME